MFFMKKNKLNEFSDASIVSPVDGDIYPIEEVDDPVFSKEMLGQTIAIKPMEKMLTLVAPANGVLEMMYPTGHAFGVRMKNGIGLLIHIGIETVELNGKGFRVLAKQNEKVRAGQAIVKVDFSQIKKAGYDTSVMVIVTESPLKEKLQFRHDIAVKASEDILEPAM